jgi:hypothetical protein
VVRGSARQAAIASSVNHTVRLPRWRRAASYSDQVMRRAKVAVARKLAVIMHRIWSDHSEYRWTAIPPTAA